MLLWCDGNCLSWPYHHSCLAEAAATTVQNFLENTKLPKSKKALQRYLGFLNYYSNYIPRLSGKLTPFLKLLTKDEKVLVTPDLLEKFSEINKALDRCGELALKQPLPNKQIALITDASFSAARYAVLIEDDPFEKYTSTKKAFAQVDYGSKTFSPIQLKMSIYAKEFLAIFFAFREFGHIFWGTPKLVIILTDNSSVTFFSDENQSTEVQLHKCPQSRQKQHRRRLLVTSRTLSKRKIDPQDQRRYSNNTN